MATLSKHGNIGSPHASELSPAPLTLGWEELTAEAKRGWRAGKDGQHIVEGFKKKI